MTELEIMLQGLPEERQKAIREKADRMEAYINSQGVLLMKDKDEEWVDGMKDGMKDGWDGNEKIVADNKKLDNQSMYKLNPKDKKVTLNGGW